MVVAVLVDSRETSIVISSVVVALFMVMVGPPGAIVQSLVPNRMRATAAGFFGVTANLVGGSLGPLFVGFLSDALRGRYGAESIRYALALSMLFWVWGQIHWYLASRHARGRDGGTGDGVPSTPRRGWRRGVRVLQDGRGAETGRGGDRGASSRTSLRRRRRTGRRRESPTRAKGSVEKARRAVY